VSILPYGHPPFLIFAVFIVANGNSQRVQNDLACAIKGDPVLSQVLPGLAWVPLKILAQDLPANAKNQCPPCRIPRSPPTILAIAIIFKSAEERGMGGMGTVTTFPSLSAGHHAGKNRDTIFTKHEPEA
jgi:hypothetical protein